MINRFMRLKTWQKLSIGIALLTIFKIFTMGMNGFIIDVKAESPSCTEPSIFIGDGNTGMMKVEDMNTKGPYKSNYLTTTQLNNIINNTYIVGIKGLELNSIHNNVSNTLIKDVEINTTGNNINTSPPNSGYTNYIDSINFTMNPSSNLEDGININSNTEYSFLIKMGNDGNEYGRSNTINDVNINISLNYKYNDSIYTSDNYNWYIIENYEYDTPGLSYTCENLSYIMVKFKTGDLLNQFTSDDNKYYIKTIDITLNNASYNMYDIVDLTSYKYFYKNTTTNGDTLHIENIYFVMDGDLILGDYESWLGVVGEPIANTQCQSCSNILDIECQINRILCYIESFIKNIIYSIKVLFNYLFIPDWNNLQNKLQESETSLEMKIPDITGFFDYMEYCNERLQNVSRQSTITFNGVKLPGYDSWVISPFTFDFDTIINDPTINTYYVIVRAVILVIVLIGYSIFCINTISSIFHNTQIGVDMNK